MKKKPVVFIVDDDPDVRLALERLMDSADYKSEAFSSADEFLLRTPYHNKCCLVLDIRMPGLNGLELQENLAQRDSIIPIVFITGYGDIPTSVKAMKKGAVDFISKPFDDKELLVAIDYALEKSNRLQKEKIEKDNVQCLFNKLTPRELEVIPWLITGILNKQIAIKMKISEKTVKFHRAHIMEKLQVVSIAELVRLAQKAEISPAKTNPR